MWFSIILNLHFIFIFFGENSNTNTHPEFVSNVARFCISHVLGSFLVLTINDCCHGLVLVLKCSGFVCFVCVFFLSPLLPNDTSLKQIWRSTATWPLDPPKDEKQGWRHVRIKQMGKNASGQTHYLSLSGFELYGTVNGVCEDQLGKKKNVYVLLVVLKS